MSSSVIIRLSNLPVTAKAADIRSFFGDLKIPKGAVNIVGGLDGDAFICFATDDDARLAMRLDGKSLHNSKIRLMLSSRSEMDSVISNARAQAAAAFSGKPTSAPQNPLSVIPKAKSPEKIKSESENLRSEAKPLFTFEFPPPLQPQQVQPPPVSIPNDSWKTNAYTVPPPTINQVVPQQPKKEEPEKSTLYYSKKSVGDNSSQAQIAQIPHYQAPFTSQGTAQNFQFPAIPPTQSPAFALQNPFAARDDPHHAHSYQQHFVGQREQPASGLGAGYTATTNYPNQDQQQSRPSSSNISVASSFHSYEQQFSRPPPQYSQQISPPASNIWLHPTGPATTVPEQKLFNVNTNVSSDSSGYCSHRMAGKPPTPNVYVELSKLPPELLKAATLEAFLSPTGAFTHTLVKFGCSEDANRVLAKDGQRGIVIRTSSEMSFNNASDGILGVLGAPLQEMPMNAAQQQNSNGKRFSPPAPQRGGRPQHDGHNQAKRRRGGAWNPSYNNAGRNENDSMGDNDQRNKDYSRPPAQQIRENHGQKSFGRDKIFVQLSNVPYKATWDNVKEFISSARARFEKITQTFYPGKNLSDRWVVELLNDRDAKSVLRCKNEILGRRIRSEYINSRQAEEQCVTNGQGDNQQGYQRNPIEQRPPPFIGNKSREHSSDSFPSTALPANTMDELITRGDLPPVAFGAFQMATAPNVGVLRSSGFTSKIGPGNYNSKNPPTDGKFPQQQHPGGRGAFSGRGSFQSRERQGRGFNHNRNARQPPFVPADPSQNQFRNKSGSQAHDSMGHSWANSASNEHQYEQPQNSEGIARHDAGFSRTAFQVSPQSSRACLLPNPTPSASSINAAVPLFKIRYNESEGQQPVLDAEKTEVQVESSHHYPASEISICSDSDRLMIVEQDSSLNNSTLNFSSFNNTALPEEVMNFPSTYSAFMQLAKQYPEMRTSIRLDNVQKQVTAEQLSQFLGVELVSPGENVARMPDGRLFVNLSTEFLAIQAISRNGAYLERNKIFVTQVKRVEMAEAIHQNLLSPQKVPSLVAEGFDKSTTAKQVAFFFEKYNPLTVELIEQQISAVVEDKNSFVITFGSAEECGAAFSVLNNSIFGDHVISMHHYGLSAHS